MKCVRSYNVRGPFVFCTVDFVLDDDEQFSEDSAVYERHSIFMRAAVGYRPPKDDNEAAVRFSVRAHPNIPFSSVLKESNRFLSTIKTMFDL